MGDIYLSRIIHRRPIFIKFELNCIDFMNRLEQKGLKPVAIEDNNVIFRLEHKEELSIIETQ